MNKCKYSLLGTALIFSLIACSEDSHTNTSSMSESDDSFAEESFISSSSLSTRLDIDYQDTISASDTMNLYLERAGKKGCNDDVICLDSGMSSVSLFLGEFVKGTRITVNVATSGMKDDTLQIRSEFGEKLKVMESVWDSTKDVGVFSNYMIPGSGADMISNKFVVFNDGFYYIDLKADFDSSSHVRINVEVDSAYYDYVGDSSKISMDLDATLRGIVQIGNAPKKIEVTFEAGTGYSIGLLAKGQWISKYELLDEDEKTVASDTGSLDQLLFPEDSTSWTLSIRPLNVENYSTGPYATFEVETNARKLEQGEYFANPDSVKLAGDTLVVVREKNNLAKYYLRQEQYVWLANLAKGDSIDIYQQMDGYYDTKLNPPSMTILDKSGDSIGTIDTYKHGFKAKSKGPIYLHYLSTLPYATDEKQELSFRTFIQRPGSLDSIAFYDESKDEGKNKYNEKTVQRGDTIYFDTFTFYAYPGEALASTRMKWFVPCEDLTVLGNAAYITNIANCEDEQEISSYYLIVQEESEGDDRARLIAQSLADPLMRDTLLLRVNEE